jgi:hypothetical protein
MSVRSIKKYFQDHDAEGRLDIKSMGRHAAAFSLYILGTLCYYIAWIFVVLNPTDKVFAWFYICQTGYFLLQFGSEVLLVTLLWDFA